MAFADWVPAAEAPSAIQGQQNQNNQSQLNLLQQQRALNALHGVNWNDPQSIQSGVNALTGLGLTDQASAIQNLQWTRSLRSQAPGDMGALASAIGGNAQSSDQQSQGQQPSDPEVQHAQETMQMAADAIQRIQQTPANQRLAAWNTERVAFADRGLPTQALDAVGQHLSDANFSDESLSDLGANYQAHAQNLGAVASGGTPGIAPTPHPTNSWGVGLLNSPGALAAISRLKAAGIDYTPMIGAAEAVAGPALAGQTAEAQVGPHLETTLYDKLIGAGIDPKVAAETARETAAATGPYKPETISTPTGSIQATPVTDKDGNVTYKPVQEAPGAGGKGGGAAGFGTTSIGAAHVASAQADQAAAILQPNPTERNQAVDTVANSQRALSILNNIKFDNLTPLTQQIANALRTAGVPGANQYATDVAGYQAIATAALAGGAHQAFPSRTTDRDLTMMKSVFPTLTTPNDQAKMAFGMQAAQAQRTEQWEDYKAGYSGDKTDPNAVYRGWLAGPGGRSIFQSPVWANVSIGGRPAFNPTTDIKEVDGKRVGAWGIGTGHPVYFRVQ